MRDLIRKILHEETRKNLTPMIRRLIDGVIIRQYEKEICDVDIDVIESGEYKVYLITVTFDIEPFQVMANAFGGSSVQEDIMNDIFMLLDSNFDIQPSLKRKYVRGCKDSQKQEQMEGELTEKCWKGYTQKGMKTMFGKRYPNCVKKESVGETDEIKFLYEDLYGSVEETDYEYNSLTEAEYQGRKVQLGKIMQGDVKKFKVYVKNDKGKVVKVNFGFGGKSAKGKRMTIKKNNPERRKSFRARHNCDNPGPRWKPRYWACRTW
jgi:hypothetical protein